MTLPVVLTACISAGRISYLILNAVKSEILPLRGRSAIPSVDRDDKTIHSERNLNVCHSERSEESRP